MPAGWGWTILFGAAGSIVAAILIGFWFRSGVATSRLWSGCRLANHLRKEGISALQWSRRDYRERLPEFLLGAKHSIGVVSISFRLPSEEAGLIGWLANRVATQSDFRVAVSLLKPKSDATRLAAEALDIPVAQLQDEIRGMLVQLMVARDQLSDAGKARFQVLVHDSLPMGMPSS